MEQRKRCPECKSWMYEDINGGIVSVNEDLQQYQEFPIWACENCDYSESFDIKGVI